MSAGRSERTSRGADTRIRIYGEQTNDELYFPAVASDGAILDRSAVGSDIRVEVFPGWRADAKVEYELENFVPTFDELDAHRWRFRSGFQRSIGAGRRLGLSHEYCEAELDLAQGELVADGGEESRGPNGEPPGPSHIDQVSARATVRPLGTTDRTPR